MDYYYDGIDYDGMKEILKKQEEEHLPQRLNPKIPVMRQTSCWQVWKQSSVAKQVIKYPYH